MANRILDADLFHQGKTPVYQPQDQNTDESAYFRRRDGQACVLYHPGHFDPKQGKAYQGNGKLFGTWMYCEEDKKKDGVLKSAINLFMDSRLEPGASVGRHRHQDTEELYLLIEGQLDIEHTWEDGSVHHYQLMPGDSHLIQPGQSHFIQAGEEGARFVVVAAKLKP